MNATKVFLHARNPVLRAGTLAVLLPCTELLVLNEKEATEAEVLVVVEEAITDGDIAAISQFRALAKVPDGLRCVIVTDRFLPSDLLPALDAGMVSAMALRDAPGRLVDAVLVAHDGTVHLPPHLQGALLAHLRRLQRYVLEPCGLTISGLTKRECDVLRLLADGLTTDKIAARLNYSERTVKTVLYGVMNRLGLNTRAQAVAYAVRVGAI